MSTSGPSAEPHDDVDPIIPSTHPWDLPEQVPILHCSCGPGSGFLKIPRDANLPIDADWKRTVAQVSQAVVGVRTLDEDGDYLCFGSGFIVEFDEASMVGTIFSSAYVTSPSWGFPEFEKIKVYLFNGASYDATIIAQDKHWNLLLLSVSFDCVVKKIEMKKITFNRFVRESQAGEKNRNENRYLDGIIIGLGRHVCELEANCGVYSLFDYATHHQVCQELQRATFISTYNAIGGPVINKNGNVIGMLFHSWTFTPFLPSNVILKWWEYFKRTGKFCRPTINITCVNLHVAESKCWKKVLMSSPPNFDGLLVETVSDAACEAGLQPNDLIVKCNGGDVCTHLQLFEILAENIGKEVELTVRRASDSTACSIYLPVQETNEDDIYRWIVLEYPG